MKSKKEKKLNYSKEELNKLSHADLYAIMKFVEEERDEWAQEVEDDRNNNVTDFDNIASHKYCDDVYFVCFELMIDRMKSLFIK